VNRSVATFGAMSAMSLLLACADERGACERPEGREYAIDFAQAAFACPSERFPETLLVAPEEFSEDGCEVVLDGIPCTGGPGYCGHLYWKEAGVYEGGLTYAAMDSTGNMGGQADCLIHSDHAVLTKKGAD
jgi:hypothetical protein